MHLRLLTRLHVVAALVIVSLITYSAWIYPSLHVTTRLTKAWSGTTRSVVVFGDSFSDTGLYAVDGPGAQRTRRNPAEGSRWTEVLCKEVVCDAIWNFAQSAENETIYSGGVVSDNEVYANTTSPNNIVLEFLPDMMIQVQQWLGHEAQQGHPANHEFVFSITLGFWDVWQYATLDLRAAQDAISFSIYSLFEQLDIIANAVDNPKIVIPKLWDVTFTPRFRNLSHETQDKHVGEEQHKIIFLTRYWNLALVHSAAQWHRGYIFLPDWHGWMLDQIRALQMVQLGMNNSLGLGLERPVFKDVSSPCFSIVPQAGSGAASTRVSQCPKPGQYLFWDDVQFSSLAHEILGKEAAKMILSNEIANALPSATDGNDNGAIKLRLKPSMAPGN